MKQKYINEITKFKNDINTKKENFEIKITTLQKELKNAKKNEVKLNGLIYIETLNEYSNFYEETQKQLDSMHFPVNGGAPYNFFLSDERNVSMIKKYYLKTVVKKNLEMLKKYYYKMLNSILTKPIKKPTDALISAISLFILNGIGSLSPEDIKLIEFFNNLNFDDNTVLAIYLSQSQKDIRNIFLQKNCQYYTIQTIMRLKKNSMYKKIHD